MKVLIYILPCLIAVQPVFAAERVPLSNDPYEVLGVDPADPDEKIAEVWRELVKIHHPDAGGTNEQMQDINESYQFLKDYRIDYDRRILPFRGVFRKRETRPVPYTYEETLRFQVLFLKYIRNENKARAELGPFAAGRPVLVLYAILKQMGDSGYYRDGIPSWRLYAYTELLRHLDLVTLPPTELKGIFGHDPVRALNELSEHYDNFTVRGSTLLQLFESYNRFWLKDDRNSLAFLASMERLKTNEQLLDRRLTAVRGMALRSLRAWLKYYFESDVDFRVGHREQYARTRRLVLALEPLPRAALTCVQLLLGRAGE